MDETAKDISAHFHLLVSAFGFAVIALFIAWRNGFFKLPAHVEIVKGHIALWELIGVFVVFLGIGVLVMPSAAYIWSWIEGVSIEDALQMPAKAWLNVITIIASAAGVAAFTASRPNASRSAIIREMYVGGVSKIVRDFLIGACAWIISYPLVIFIGQLIAIFVLFEFPSGPVDQVAVKFLKATMEYPLLFSVTAFLIIFVVPIMEELLFRGYLQTWLKQQVGVYYAIFLTSVIFASFHFSISQGISNIELLSSLFILSCFLGFLYERQQSLVASIGLHVTFNFISVIAILSS